MSSNQNIYMYFSNIHRDGACPKLILLAYEHIQYLQLDLFMLLAVKSHWNRDLQLAWDSSRTNCFDYIHVLCKFYVLKITMKRR